MTLFERVRLWLSPTGRDIGWPADQVWPESNKDLYDELPELLQDDIDLMVDPIAEAKAKMVTDAMADEWANEGGACPPGQVPNCS